MAARLLFFSLALTCAFAAPPAPENRIVGGTPVTIQEFPYIAALVYHFPGPNIFVQRCVGSIVSSWHVLTTAFCFTGANLQNLKVRAGSTHSLSGGTVVDIRNVIRHPGYVHTPRTADIAVVILSTPLMMSETIKVLYIPPQGTYIPDGTSTKVVSWGFESESGPQLQTLKSIILKKVPLEQCQLTWEGDDSPVIDDPVICAANPGYGVCYGDSGAPMVINDVVVGLASDFKECGKDMFPDVFTRIDRYTNWIMEVATAPHGGLPVRIAKPY